jgi:CDP-diglyceride synthetase
MLIAVVIVLIAFAAYTCSGRFILFLAGFLLAIGCAWEVSDVCSRNAASTGTVADAGTPAGSFSARRLCYFLACAAPAISTLTLSGHSGFCPGGAVTSGFARAGLGLIIGFMIAMGFLVWIAEDHIEDARTVAHDLFIALILVGLGGASIMLLAALPDAHRIVSWALLVICLNDIFAYLGGVKFGGAKLAPVISPNKTISGSLSGLAAGVFFGVLFSGLLTGSSLGRHMEWWSVAILSCLIVLAAQLGDLSKSYIKRLHKVKDTGTILPGHGGILDRIDALLAGGPLLYFWILF